MSALRRLASVGRSHRMVPLGRITILVQGALALAFVAYLLANQGFRAPWNAGSYPVEAVFADAAGLNEGDEPAVTVAGVEVGNVTEVRYEDGRAIATLKIEDEHARRVLRSDATASIAPRSALNDLEVDIDPGSAPEPLGDDVQIPERRTESSVALDEVIGTLDADTRAWAQVLLGELRTGLRGRTGEIAEGLRELGRLTRPTADVGAALADRRRLLARLIGQLDTIFGSLADRGTSLAATIRTGHQTLAVTTAREEELTATMRRLPDTLAALDGALGEVERLSGPLSPALEQLRPFARRLPAGLRSLRRFVPTGRGLVDDLAPLARGGAGPARDLRRLLAELGPTSPALVPVVRDMLETGRAVDRNRDGISQLGENFSGVFSTNDGNGPILRGLGYFEEFRCENFGFSGELFPNCGPPAGQSGERVDPAPLVLRALSEICHGGERVAHNRAACLPIYYSPELVRELPELPDGELARVRGELAHVLDAKTLAALRRDLAALLDADEVARVVPARSRVGDVELKPIASLAEAGR